MQRNKDLIREIILRLEALAPRRSSYFVRGDREPLVIEGYTPEEINYHLRQVVLAGFLDLEKEQPLVGAIMRGLKPKGHDFTDSVRDPETWKKTKDAAEKAGGWTLELLGDLAKGLIKKQIERHTGVAL